MQFLPQRKHISSPIQILIGWSINLLTHCFGEKFEEGTYYRVVYFPYLHGEGFMRSMPVQYEIWIPTQHLLQKPGNA
jgi:hypothetical protein